MSNKKAQVMSSLAGLSVGIATFAIVIVVAFLVMSNTKTQLGVAGACDNPAHLYNASSAAGVCCINTTVCTGANGGYGGTSNAWNSTNTLQNATAGVPGWIPLVVIVAIGSVILGMIGMFRR